MTATDKEFVGSIPEFYDTYLVPLIFEAYANDLAKRISSLNPKSVLEMAAGSGVVPRALAPHLDAEARYVVTDLNQPMLDHASNKQGPDERIEWKQVDALDLPFEDNSFDVAACQYGVMFFPDRIKGYSEARRVLKAGGRYIFSVWDEIGTNEFANVVTTAAAAVFPNDPPNFLPRTPHGYSDQKVIRDELVKAGFSNVEIVTVEETSKAPSPRHPAIAYCQGTPLRNEIEQRDAELLEHVTECAAEAISRRYGNGEVEAKIQAHIVTAIS
jgi:ubiquinone/menaquinone biosynthesis C-methylase UbiE